MVWGGAPAIFDMRTGNAPMGAIETAMLNAACSQVGRSLGLPTHGYLCGSDAKVVDAQAGLETGMAALTGVLAGMSMISGAGMLDFAWPATARRSWCSTPRRSRSRSASGEDIEARGSRWHWRCSRGPGRSGAAQAQGNLFREEQYLPSPVIDRASLRGWQDAGALDAFARARARADQLVAEYRRPALAPEREAAMLTLMRAEAARVGLTTLPGT